MADTWDTKEVYDYTIDDALEAWREFECGAIADEMLKSFQYELAAMRAKAAAFERIYERCRLYNREFPHGTDATTLVMHLGRFARDEVYQFQEEHNGR